MIRRLGDWVLRRAGHDVFEVMHLDAGGAPTAVARVGIESHEVPTLMVERLRARPETIEHKPAPAQGRIVLSDCRQGDPDCFRLTAELSGDDLEVTLAGDSPCEAGGRHYRLFWWHAEFGISGGEVVIHGPSLSSDPWS